MTQAPSRRPRFLLDVELVARGQAVRYTVLGGATFDGDVVGPQISALEGVGNAVTPDINTIGNKVHVFLFENKNNDVLHAKIIRIIGTACAMSEDEINEISVKLSGNLYGEPLSRCQTFSIFEAQARQMEGRVGRT